MFRAYLRLSSGGQNCTSIASGVKTDYYCTRMHGQQNVKICVAKQAKQVYLYKTIKMKFYKNNAAIWFNKTCRIKQLVLTPEVILVQF
jgi:hypothetical protein